MITPGVNDYKFLSVSNMNDALKKIHIFTPRIICKHSVRIFSELSYVFKLTSFQTVYVDMRVDLRQERYCVW